MTPETMARVHARAFEPGARGWRAAEFAALLSDPSVIVTGDDRAFAVARVVVDEAELLTLATDPGQRRQGLARRCLTQLLKDVADCGAARLFLEVAADNSAARALYRNLGFVQIGLRAAYYPRDGGAAVDALILERRLDPTG